MTARRTHRSRLVVPDASAGPSTSPSAANLRSETETEDHGDVDMDTSRNNGAPSPSPERQQHTDTGTIRVTHSRRAVGIILDMAAPVVRWWSDLREAEPSVGSDFADGGRCRIAKSGGQVCPYRSSFGFIRLIRAIQCQ